MQCDFKHFVRDFNFSFDNMDSEGYSFTTRHMTRLAVSAEAFLTHFQSTLLQYQCCILNYDPASTTVC